MRKISVGLATALLGAGLLLGGAQSASAATWGVNMQNACDTQVGPGSSAGVYAGWNVMGWRCRFNGGWNHIDQSINVNKWCQARYGAVARYSDYNNPYSWYCLR